MNQPTFPSPSPRQQAIEIITDAKLRELEAAGLMVIARSAFQSLACIVDSMTPTNNDENKAEFASALYLLLEALCGVENTRGDLAYDVKSVLLRTCAGVESIDGRTFAVDMAEDCPRFMVRCHTMQPNEHDVVDAWAHRTAREANVAAVIVVATPNNERELMMLEGWLPEEISGCPMRVVILTQ